MTPVEELREAARLMRETAEKATPSADPYPGGWAGFGTDATPVGNSMLFGGPAEDGYRTGTVFTTDEHCDACVGMSDADVQHIASWHPAVALAVAAWLAGVAAAIEMGDRYPETYPVTAEVANARAVARAYLGGDRG